MDISSNEPVTLHISRLDYDCAEETWNEKLNHVRECSKLEQKNVMKSRN